ncbi:putative beta-phosphoglucomutase [Burkholderia pseudomallei MSHR3709]|nr:putative beta-phosphoglucomutase [Burkholderia pseudomallei MSHR3709]
MAVVERFRFHRLILRDHTRQRDSAVRSASSAGIFTFGMLTALDEEQLREAGAKAVIRDFGDRKLWEFLERAPGR